MTTAILVAASAVATVLVAVVGGGDRVAAVDVTFTVNSVNNGSDAVIDGTCATAGTTNCTLRAAVQEANAHSGGDVTIEFDIAGGGLKTISLPQVLTLDNADGRSITIDGFTQSDATPNSSSNVDNAVRRIELVGTGPNGNAGIQIHSPGNVVRGLIMNEFSIAIRIDGNGGVRFANNNRIVGNMIGLDADGSLAPGYNSGGSITGNPCISIVAGPDAPGKSVAAANNFIGTPALADRNTISGCYERGIYLDNQNTFSNDIQNNIIGMDPSGTARRPNWIGVDINGGAQSNIVGGTGANEGNLLSGNNISAVEISHDTNTTGNNVLGNRIGTTPNGNGANAQTANGGDGIRLEGKRSEGAFSNCNQNAGATLVRANVIVNSGRGGILIDKGFHDASIRENRIGVTLNGTVVGNSIYGVRILAGARRTIVGENEIAGGQYGIQVSPKSIDPPQPAGDDGCPTNFNTFTDNIIRSVSANGIDLANVPLTSPLYGTATSDGVPSSLANEGILRGTISSQNGTVTVQTCNGCVVELFGTTRPTGQFGLGETFITSKTASASGVANFSTPGAGWPARVTATVTNPAGSTSEFTVAIVPTATTPPIGPPGLEISERAEPPTQSADRIGNRVRTV